MSRVGLRPHIYFPASDIQGPFLALLQANEAAGLRLRVALPDMLPSGTRATSHRDTARICVR